MDRAASFLVPAKKLVSIDSFDMADTRQPHDENMLKLMRAAYSALSKGDLRQLEKLVAETPAPVNPDAALATVTPEVWGDVVRSKQSQRTQVNWRYALVAVVGVAMLTYLCVTLGLGMYCVGQPNECHQWAIGTYTPTIARTKTPTPVATPSPTFTPPPTETPTADPAPPSIYLASDTAALYPRVPLDADAVWVLNGQSVVVQPPLTDTAVWKQATSSDAQANQASFFYTETGNFEATWTLDVPLSVGLYQLYVLDTMSQSTGAQEFVVRLDGVPATPYRGQSAVIFNGANSTDDWLPLGAYEVVQEQHLSVQVAVGARSPDTPFALDRLLIAKISDAQKHLLDALPQGRVLVSLLDDDRATFSAVSGSETTRLSDEYHGQIQTGASAWNGSFRSHGSEIWVAAGNTLQVDWAPIGRLPAGQYELYVRIPAQHAAVVADYALLADGNPVPRETPARVRQADFTGAWVSLGIWQLEGEAAVGVRMIVSKENQDEIGVDAVALARVGE
jgi:hypothetical protein